MSLSKGTPLSSQIVWFEKKVAEQTEEIERLQQIKDDLNARLIMAILKNVAKDKRIAELEQALQAILNRYVGLVESGDAGNWDAETEPEVIQARKALEESQ